MNDLELRIGNIISYRGETDVQVSNVGHYLETINIINGIPYGSDDISDYEPIPLTTEWLLKLGFIQFEIFDRKLSFFHIYINGERSAIEYHLNQNIIKLVEYDFGGYWYGIDCKYVHQLQNIFFIHTGTELTMKGQQ